MSVVECPNCGQSFSAVLMVCPHCGAVRGGRPEGSSPVAPSLLEGADPSSFRDLRGVTLFLQFVLTGVAVVGVVGAVNNVSYRNLLGELLAGTYRGTTQEALDLEARVQLLATYRLVLYLLTIVMMIVWLYRVYVNLPHLARERKYKQGWVIGGWFVPFLNLVRPFSLIRDAWAKSAPALDAPPPSSDAAPPIITVWWLTWVIALAGVSNIAGQIDDSTLEGAPTVVGWWIAGDVLMAATMLMALPVVRSVTRRQEARCRNLIEARRRSPV